MYGPSLNFIPGNEVSVIREGKKVSAIIDRNYIIRSIKQPDIEKVEGYENKKMTPVNLTSKQIGLITDYLIFINTNAAREQSQ